VNGDKRENNCKNSGNRQPSFSGLALRVYDEDRSLMASIAGADYMGAAVYALRPNGRIPSDPVVVEQ
jgi:hypothetical protein